VPARVVRRNSVIRRCATAESQTRSWFARIEVQLARVPKRSSCCSFDAVLHLTPGAVLLFVQGLGAVPVGAVGGDHEARVVLARKALGFADDATLATPRRLRAVSDVAEDPGRLAALLMLLAGLRELGVDLAEQRGIARHPDDVLDSVRLAPSEDRLTREARVASHDDLRGGPLRPQLRHEPLQGLYGAEASVDVGLADARQKQRITAENVER